jgi:biotin carboxylase
VTGEWLVLVESNTTGSGQLFCARARRLGLRPVVFARDPTRYPYLIADAVDIRVLDTADALALGQACAALGPIAGVTSSSEYFVAAASELARQLGLPHPDPGAVTRCRDKGIQRFTLRAGGLAGPDFDVVGTPAEAAAAAARLGMPVVVKPCSGSGSVGVRRCACPDEVFAAASAILDGDPAQLGIPQQRQVLVEQYLDGPEYSVETFDRQVVGITAKHLGPEPHFVEIGHDFPAMLADSQQADLTGQALRALDVLGLGWGPAHLELRLTRHGARIVEVNPRLAGGMIPRLVQEATGVDLIALTVARAAGRPVELTASLRRAASIRFLLLEKAGTPCEPAGLALAAAVPGIVAATFTGPTGSPVTVRHTFRDRVGYVISAGQDGVDAARAADHALAQIELRLEPGNVPDLTVAKGRSSQ